MGLFRPGVYHVPGRRGNLTACCAGGRQRVTEDLQDTSKSAVRMTWTLLTFSCYELQCVVFQGVFRGYKSHLTPWRHTEILHTGITTTTSSALFLCIRDTSKSSVWFIIQIGHTWDIGKPEMQLYLSKRNSPAQYLQDTVQYLQAMMSQKHDICF